MCGICGILNFGPSTGAEPALVKVMADTLQHRGPDAEGYFSDLEAGIFLGHRRLSIVDLSSHGAQPMKDSRKNYIISFNGEIYNHRSLRYELVSSGVEFRGSSDTEVLLESISRWGVEATLRKAVGMFAFAVWDRRSRVLTLARDRVGEKPLYYALTRKGLVFASELKALRATIDPSPVISAQAVDLYFRLGYVPHPYSIYENVFQLTPGAYLSVAERDRSNRNLKEPVIYWDHFRNFGEPIGEKPNLSEPEALRRLNELINESVKGQIMADVPVGAMLSGGVDSSIVVATMQSHSSRPINTYTVGFEDKGISEAEAARETARSIGTNHTEIIVSHRDAINEIPAIAGIYDEPLSDSSQIPTYLISKLCKREVTVCLSGDGGDEILLGYTSYARAKAINSALHNLPRCIRLKLRSPIEKMLVAVGSLLPETILGEPVYPKLDKLGKGARLLGFSSLLDLHLQAAQSSPYRYLRNTIRIESPVSRYVSNRPSALEKDLRSLGLCDLMFYTSSDILTKVDRAGMAVSLETRMPLLDHRLIEFCYSLGEKLKMRNGSGKYLLRRLLIDKGLESTANRRKQGFDLPIENWLRGPMRNWVEDLLSTSSLSAHDFLDFKGVQAMWKEHLSGRRRWHFEIWKILMFQSWFRLHAK
jgi:asparagine synthase (glutamine-hydrolysing)